MTVEGILSEWQLPPTHVSWGTGELLRPVVILPSPSVSTCTSCSFTALWLPACTHTACWFNTNATSITTKAKRTLIVDVDMKFFSYGFLMICSAREGFFSFSGRSVALVQRHHQMDQLIY
jgi:hypothetical protein